MKRFELGEYECSMLQNETRKMFESDNIEEILKWAKEYFEKQSYFNCIGLKDNTVNKDEYVGGIGRETIFIGNKTDDNKTDYYTYEEMEEKYKETKMENGEKKGCCHEENIPEQLHNLRKRVKLLEEKLENLKEVL